MILEAFSRILQSQQPVTDEPAQVILHRWLVSLLEQPLDSNDAGSVDHVVRVIQTELALSYTNQRPVIMAKSLSGQRLLHTLQWYCDSYEQWQFRRWLHQANTAHFGG